MGAKNTLIGRLLGSAATLSAEQVTQTIDLLIDHAVAHRASDIHIEPQERFVQVRYRINGVLHGMHKLPAAARGALIEQLKALAHLPIEEDPLPQEGHFSVLVGEDQFEVQVNTLPVVGGEKAVLHISRRLSKPPALAELGYWGHGLQALRGAVSHPHGLILIASPRRSGQTTTMHSILALLTTPAVSVATVEHTIEYRLSGVSQTKVRPQHGITFYQGLQAALAQDPNIVLASSLADGKTAELAVRAAAAGHLIIGGTHADNAVAALMHVRNMSGEPLLFANAIRATVSQRLLRRLCPKCRQHYIPSPDQLAELEKTFRIDSAASRRTVHELEQHAALEDIGDNRHSNTTPSRITGLWRADDNGCDACNHTGYQGSVAIVEVLVVHDALKQALLEHTPASKLHTLALQEGYLSMGLDGLVKALRGQTTISEVLRTIAI